MPTKKLKILGASRNTNSRCANKTICESLLRASGARAEVIELDLIKPPRAFRDKSEWMTVLEALASAGKLQYIAESDSIKLPGSDDTTE